MPVLMSHQEHERLVRELGMSRALEYSMAMERSRLTDVLREIALTGDARLALAYFAKIGLPFKTPEWAASLAGKALSPSPGRAGAEKASSDG